MKLLTTPNLNGNLGIEHKVEDGITLGEFLKDIKPGTYVAIGAASSFFYIGPVEEFTEDIPMIDFHYHFMSARDTIPKKYTNSETGEMYIHQKPYVPHVPFLQHRVTKYYARRIDGEPAMWIIEVDGPENGEIWLLEEYERLIAKDTDEFNSMRSAKSKRKFAV